MGRDDGYDVPDYQLFFISGSDHASHICEASRERWLRAVEGFLEYGDFFCPI